MTYYPVLLSTKNFLINAGNSEANASEFQENLHACVENVELLLFFFRYSKLFYAILVTKK